MQADKKVAMAEPTLTVTRQYGKYGKHEVKEETMDVRGFAVEPARVQVDFGLTLSLGKYETVRIGVSVSLPCYREELDEAYNEAREWATERIQKEAQAIRTNRG